MMDNYTNEEILINILDCGVDDLSLVRNIKYDLNEIMRDLKRDKTYPSLENIMVVCMYYACDKLNEAVENCLDFIENGELNVSEEEKRKIEKLNPDSDLYMNFNYLTTKVFMKHKDIYEKYVPDLIRDIEEYLGMPIEEG